MLCKFHHHGPISWVVRTSSFTRGMKLTNVWILKKLRARAQILLIVLRVTWNLPATTVSVPRKNLPSIPECCTSNNNLKTMCCLSSQVSSLFVFFYWTGLNVGPGNPSSRVITGMAQIDRFHDPKTQYWTWRWCRPYLMLYMDVCRSLRRIRIAWRFGEMPEFSRLIFFWTTIFGRREYLYLVQVPVQDPPPLNNSCCYPVQVLYIGTPSSSERPTTHYGTTTSY